MTTPRPRRRPLLTSAATLLAAGLTLPLAACGGGTPAATGSSSGTGAAGAKLAVVVGFYPLEYAVTRVGGDRVTVTNLTKAGVEPHDLELTPQETAKLSAAPLAVTLSGFQPAVDKATAGRTKPTYDVSKDADLSLAAPPDEDGHEAKPGAKDPHFWLDPVRYAKVAKAVAGQLASLDPDHRADYERNAATLAGELTALDTQFSDGLKTCRQRNLVTSHAAFGYLAERYHFTQKAITGLSPEGEPAPAALARLAAFVREQKVTTVYTETLVSPAVAQTIAKEAGATTAVLDPIEGLADATAGKTYLDLMRVNLDTLKKGQGCS